jgi:hypothetical protein
MLAKAGGRALSLAAQIEYVDAMARRSNQNHAPDAGRGLLSGGSVADVGSATGASSAKKSSREQPEITPSKKRRNLALDDFRSRYVAVYWSLAHDQGRPSYEDMAEAFRIGEKSVERYVGQLRLEGLPYPPPGPQDPDAI